jgi:hypothetical protein
MPRRQQVHGDEQKDRQRDYRLPSPSNELQRAERYAHREPSARITTG